ncbi:hypothetical protein [Aquimarina macrocephali]|uniref:hypothetical protein n=1 Tax=Aquimarina macrocephali TaxID=666563 RepID=UPI003F662523
MIFLFSYLLFELMAAIAGSFYIRKCRGDRFSRYFVYFLWLTLFVELFGTIPALIYYGDLFPSLKGTFLEKNHWLYNIFFIYNFSFYIYYFCLNYKTEKLKVFMKALMVAYVLGAIVNLIFSDIYFIGISPFTYIVGTILLFVGGILYLYEILQSDKILTFYKTIPFYIAVGSVIFHLVVTPLFIYSKFYHMEKSPEFVDVRKIILNSAIIFMYTCYTIGFIVCSRKNKSY